MKKSFIFAFAAMVAFASCGNKAAQSSDTENPDSTEVTAEASEVAEASEAVTSALESNLNEGDMDKVKASLTTIQQKYQQLVESGKLEEAKAYALKIQKYVNENTDKIKEITGNNPAIAALVDGIKALPTDATATAEEALKAVEKNTQNLVNTQVEKVNKVANEKVDEAKAKVKDAVNSEVEKAKQQAGDAAKKAVGDAASRLLGK